MLKTNYTFDVSITELFGWFIGCGHLEILPPKAELDPAAVTRYIEQYAVSHVNFAPSALRVFIQYVTEQPKWLECNPIRFLMVAGEAFAKDLVEQTVLLMPNTRVDNIYGPTEAAIYAASYNCSANTINSLNTPIGNAIDGTRLYIVDQQLAICDPGVPGELCIVGNGLARGYINQDELTADKFIKNPFAQDQTAQIRADRLYKTGDLCQFLADGTIEYLGRIDNQVKIRGYRIELGEIENQLNRHEQIKAAAVIAKSINGLQQLVAYYCPATNHQSSTLAYRQLKDYLGLTLPQYMIPAFFVVIDEMPTTPSAKIDRKALKARDLPGEKAATVQWPSADIEGTILAIWQQVLGLHDINPNDHFFDVGGNSINVHDLVRRINQTLNVQLQSTAIFEFTTISKLATHLADQNVMPLPGKPATESKTAGIELAIVGWSGRFPGATDIPQFWQNIIAGKNCIEALPDDRNLAQSTVKWGGFIEGISAFDSLFFELSPNEAKLIDPQQRLLLTHTYQALENAGIAPDSFSNKPSGVFIAASSGDYRNLGQYNAEDDPYLVTASMTSMIPARLSHFFDLHGPSEFIESACSSALVALHHALHAINRGECEQAIIGAVNLLIDSKNNGCYQSLGLLSPDKYSYPFDKKAQGYVRAEGVGVIVVKKLDDALADGNRILALLKGTGVCHGGKGMSLTAPNAKGMRSAIVQALQAGAVDP
ncbi:MAG: AMP-binding protein, partial [Algicola sp.]|nr:AMP-binding protein [Algicola sp.]